jgi:hypothetical protein
MKNKFIYEPTQSRNFKIGWYAVDHSLIPATVTFGQMEYIKSVFYQYLNNELPSDFITTLTDIQGNVLAIKLIDSKLKFGVVLDYAGYVLDLDYLDGVLIRKILDNV